MSSSAEFSMLMADITYHLAMATKYGGNLFEYLDDCGKENYDLYVQGDTITFVVSLINNAKRMPDVIYGDFENVTEITISWEKRLKVKVYPVKMMEKVYEHKVMITLCDWNWQFYKKLQANNYEMLSFSAIVEYTLFKNIIFGKCLTYLEKLGGVKTLFTKYPRADQLEVKSPLESYLCNNHVWGYTPELNEKYKEFGLDISTIKNDVRGNGVFINSVFRYDDTSTDNMHVINGIRVTSDVPTNSKHTIWMLGSSVVAGFFVDDEHTISSAMQRELNGYFHNNSEYSVVNASNHSSNEVWHVYDFIKSLPIRKGDICIFHMDYPKILAQMEPQIVDFNKIFSQPHNYGEIFIDIRHMNGNGYHAQAKEIFKILVENGYFSNETVQEVPEKLIENKTPKLTKIENIELQQYIDSLSCYRERVGAIVMNCNPFTLGHRYLVEESAKKVDKLFVFVVQEDKSYFKFDDRIELVRKGTADLKNVIVIPSGKFIISQRTFEAYSNKANLQDKVIDASMDVEIFAQHIAPSLGISVRFAGEEPLDNVTKQYNDTMSRILPEYGIEFEVIPRKEQGGIVISASRVRKLLEEEKYEEIKELVPSTTYEYLMRNKD